MTDDPGLTRRQALLAGGTALAAAPMLSAFTQGQEVRAEGQGFPRGVTLPEEPFPEPGEGSLGIAVVGLGGYALGQMMPAFARSERCHIAALVSGNREKAERVASAYGVPGDALYGYGDFSRIASDPRVDAVYIVLPTGLHAEWTARAFAAGKHVLCEKPMALSPAEGERMIRAAERANRRLMIAYRCHFEPYNLKLMALMRDGALGQLRTIRTTHQYVTGPATPATNWRLNRAMAGGGPLEDYGLYGLQAALYITGEMPARITAATMQPKDDPRFAEIAAHTASQLTFPSGATAQLSTSYDAPGLNRIDIFGSDGRLTMEPATGYGGQTMTIIRGRERETLDPGDPSVQFAGQLDHFAAAIRNGSEIRTPGEMGLRDLRLIEAIYRSAARGETVTL